MSIRITIDGSVVEAKAGEWVLDAARRQGLDIPALCYLEKCGPLNSCQVCLVKIGGKLVPSCGTRVQDGMEIESETEEVHEARRTALELLFSDHVGDCLAPCNRLCPLGLNIPLMLRQIQGGRIGDALVNARGSLPLAGVLGRLCHHPCEQGCRRGNWDDPAAIRDMERFVTDSEPGEVEPFVPPRKAPSGKTVAVIGAGPAGLSAAWSLVRQGHKVTLADRHERAGGSLRELPETALPPAVLARETRIMELLGVEFRLNVELGQHVTIDGLARSFDAILLTPGETSRSEWERLGLAAAGNYIKCDPNDCRTPVAKVFAAGAAARQVKQLVRAMVDGRAAAECVHRSLSGQAVRRPEKVFSSVMGRLSLGELKEFLMRANLSGSVSPCDRCAGHNRAEAALEASRCLHCDCRSSGNCVLQHYAQVYGANASRFRSERRRFEQESKPGGVIFEPGKCILCGICVKLTEMAREPLGLTFIGRGFDVRIGAPLNHTITDGLQKVAEECVKHCPTGALAFAEGKLPEPVATARTDAAP